MNGTSTRPLRDVISPRNDIVHPRDNPTGVETFVGLEHIQPNTGRRIGAVPIDLGQLTGRKARFLPGDIVYGYLRPYLNKVWIAEFAGFCSVDQYVFIVDEGVADHAYVASYLRSPAYLAAAPIDETPGQLPRIRIDEVLSTPIPLPPLDEQRRISARLRNQLARRDSLAGHLSRMQLDIDQLERRLITEAASIDADAPTASIGDLTDSPPSPSVKLDGEVSVVALTSGCLTSSGWSEAGLKVARMHPSDVARGTLGASEILVSRSNTEELVGRSAVFPGSTAPIVATDLIFRLRANRARLLPEYLAIQLQAMQLRGYWHDRSSGAASTMKKITGTQLNAAVIPIPALDEQHRIAARLREQLAEIDRAKAALDSQRRAVDALPAALLREVFSAQSAA